MAVTVPARLKLRLSPYTAMNTNTNTSAKLQTITIPAIRLARPVRAFFSEAVSVMPGKSAIRPRALIRLTLSKETDEMRWREGIVRRVPDEARVHGVIGISVTPE